LIYSTHGLLLSVIKHSDSSAILHIFSKDFGRKAYFLRGLTKKKNSPRAYLNPLTILELQVTERESKSLQQIRDISVHIPTNNLIIDPIKACMSMFITEILHKSIEENYVNGSLYLFLESAIQLLDNAEKVKNFHVWFLVALSKFLGFYPMIDTSVNSAIFNLETGTFIRKEEESPLTLSSSASITLKTCLGMNFDEVSHLKMSASLRKELVHGLVKYYTIHVPKLNKVNSLEVLEAVFDY